MPGVLISYRHVDTGECAKHLKLALTIRYGRSLVWQDVTDLKLSADFVKQIEAAISSADAVLVLIGPTWLRDEQGRERLKESDDVLCHEVETALRSDCKVIPVLVGDTSMPAPKELPSSISSFSRCQAALLRDIGRDLHGDVQVLLDGLREIVRAKRESRPLQKLHQELDQMQQDYFRLLRPDPRSDPRPDPQPDPEAALKLARRTLELLDDQTPHYPDDLYLLLVRAYSYKNEAMALRDLGDRDGFANALQEADIAFQTIRREAELRMAGAYNGVGSVEMLRGRSNEALRWIDRALELVPDYPAALHDKAVALGSLVSRWSR